MNLLCKKPFIITFVFFMCNIYFSRGLSDSKTNVKLFVNGDGFHRLLTYKIKTKLNLPKCYMALYLNLPSTLYVNLDELAELRRKNNNLICSEGETSVESFAEKALSQQISTCAVSRNVVKLSIPIHQRYQFATPEGGYNDIHFPHIKLLLGCQEKVADLTISEIKLCSACRDLANNWFDLPYKFENETYVWQVPVGKTAHSKFVTVITLITTFAGAVLILRTLWQIDVSQNKKD